MRVDLDAYYGDDKAPSDDYNIPLYTCRLKPFRLEPLIEKGRVRHYTISFPDGEKIEFVTGRFSYSGSTEVCDPDVKVRYTYPCDRQTVIGLSGFLIRKVYLAKNLSRGAEVAIIIKAMTSGGEGMRIALFFN